MTALFVAAAALCVLGVVAGEAAARRFQSRLADAGRSKFPAPPEKVSIRW